MSDLLPTVLCDPSCHQADIHKCQLEERGINNFKCYQEEEALMSTKESDTNVTEGIYTNVNKRKRQMSPRIRDTNVIKRRDTHFSKRNRHTCHQELKAICQQEEEKNVTQRKSHKCYQEDMQRQRQMSPQRRDTDITKKKIHMSP